MDCVVHCECCERKKGAAVGWVVGREGEDLCPDCVSGLNAEVARKIAELPGRIGLCPDCAPEFYYPLADDEDPSCPTPECSHTLIIYEKARVKSKAQVVQECIDRLSPLDDDAPTGVHTAPGDIVELLRDLRDFYERGES
jgi:hypothetical protein